MAEKNINVKTKSNCLCLLKYISETLTGIYNNININNYSSSCYCTLCNALILVIYSKWLEFPCQLNHIVTRGQNTYNDYNNIHAIEWF